MLPSLGEGMDRQQTVAMERSRQNFDHAFTPGKSMLMTGSWREARQLYIMRETPTAKSGERSGEIPSKRKALCWKTHLDPICCLSSLEMHQTV